MPFITKENKSTNLLDISDARLLYKTITTHTSLAFKPNLERWQASLAKLREQVGRARILAAITWLNDNFKAERTPKVHSADSFCGKFDRIEQAARISETTTATSPPIGEVAVDISRRAGLAWPGDEAKAELEFIQRTLNSYHLWRSAIGFAYHTKTDERQAMIDEGRICPSQLAEEIRLLWIYDTQLMGDIAHADWWLSEAHKIAHTWPRWKGNLLAWVWQPRGRAYAKAVAQFGGLDAAGWDGFCAMIDVEMESQAHANRTT